MSALNNPKGTGSNDPSTINTYSGVVILAEDVDHLGTYREIQGQRDSSSRFSLLAQAPTAAPGGLPVSNQLMGYNYVYTYSD